MKLPATSRVEFNEERQQAFVAARKDQAIQREYQL
jgi:hypothetical protein